jgi:hypothetical protein
VERDISFYKELEKTCSFDYMKQNKEDDLVQLNDTTNTQIHDRSLSWLGTGTLIRNKLWA